MCWPYHKAKSLSLFPSPALLQNLFVGCMMYLFSKYFLVILWLFSYDMSAFIQETLLITSAHLNDYYMLHNGNFYISFFPIQKITSKVELKDNATAPVSIRYFSKCIGSTEKETSVCQGLRVGDQVEFRAEVTVSLILIFCCLSLFFCSKRIYSMSVTALQTRLIYQNRLLAVCIFQQILLHLFFHCN